MAENLRVESPDFERIRQGDNQATMDGMKLLWYVLNGEIRSRRTATRLAQELVAPKVKTFAPSGNTNNLALDGASILLVDTTSSTNLTGMVAPETGDSRIVIIHNINSGTLTAMNQSASSDAGNRFLTTKSPANRAITTDLTMVVQYLNSRWRELTFA